MITMHYRRSSLSPHLIEDHVRILQGLDLLLPACNPLVVVRPCVHAGRLQLGQLLECLRLELSVLLEVLLEPREICSRVPHLALLSLDAPLLLADVRLTLVLEGRELTVCVGLGALGSINGALKIRLDHIKLPNDA